jgi:uncharacterized FlaG/YvyC family protein
MAVEDTDKINAGIDPVENQVRFKPRKAKADDSSRGSVSSPAASVEDRIAEKTAQPQVSMVHSPEDNLKVKESETAGKAVTKSELEEITEGINSELSFFSNSIQFKIEEVDETSDVLRMGAKKQDGSADQMIRIRKKEIVVNVVDKRTGEVIRKIPPEDLLQSLYNASMFLGLLVDQIV